MLALLMITWLFVCGGNGLLMSRSGQGLGCRPTWRLATDIQKAAHPPDGAPPDGALFAAPFPSRWRLVSATRTLALVDGAPEPTLPGWLSF